MKYISRMMMIVHIRWSIFFYSKRDAAAYDRQAEAFKTIIRVVGLVSGDDLRIRVKTFLRSHVFWDFGHVYFEP